VTKVAPKSMFQLRSIQARFCRFLRFVSAVLSISYGSCRNSVEYESLSLCHSNESLNSNQLGAPLAATPHPLEASRFHAFHPYPFDLSIFRSRGFIMCGRAREQQ